jgi:hypothetical protein
MHRRRSLFYGSITRAPTNGPETADRSGKWLPHTFTKPPAKNHAHNVVQNKQPTNNQKKKKKKLSYKGIFALENSGKQP